VASDVVLAEGRWRLRRAAAALLAPVSLLAIVLCQ
jgi:hypothetical protein